MRNIVRLSKSFLWCPACGEKTKGQWHVHFNIGAKSYRVRAILAEHAPAPSGLVGRIVPVDGWEEL